MITYKTQSSIVSVSTTPTLIFDANRDRVHLEFILPNGIYLGDSGVSTSTGYTGPFGVSDFAFKLDGRAATAAVYGVVAAGTSGLQVLEVIPA